ncbi:MAG: DnaJ domain-containing protein, partial [Deltaproteobacteria bacterium]|nr:DnaJ domain-containing protein [Deltaproteobacteria bacterium]
IRRAYFRLSKEFHPDRYYGKDLGSYREMLGAVFKDISEAFATLADDSRRQAYVMKLRDSVATPAPQRRKPR